jgi:hypothetical protein
MTATKALSFAAAARSVECSRVQCFWLYDVNESVASSGWIAVAAAAVLAAGSADAAVCADSCSVVTCSAAWQRSEWRWRT